MTRKIKKESPSNGLSNQAWIKNSIEESIILYLIPRRKTLTYVYEDQDRKYSMSFWKQHPYYNEISYNKIEILDYQFGYDEYINVQNKEEKLLELVQIWGILGTDNHYYITEKLPLFSCITKFNFLVDCNQVLMYTPLDIPEDNENTVILTFPVQRLIRFIYGNSKLLENFLVKRPLDWCYKNLNSTIIALDKNCEIFSMIHQYVKNTHSEFHYHFRIQINDIFMINRHGEEENYTKDLHNKKLLWHGTKLNNIGAILSKGLKICPLNAKHTGHMFGKGIYFTNIASKAANYSKSIMCNGNPQGIMLLCEVALGNMIEYYRAQNMKKLPNGVHSVFVRGISSPRDTTHISRGVEVPFGPLVNVPLFQKPQFRHNQFVIYNPAQVRIRYLVCVDFKCLS